MLDLRALASSLVSLAATRAMATIAISTAKAVDVNGFDMARTSCTTGQGGSDPVCRARGQDARQLARAEPRRNLVQASNDGRQIGSTREQAHPGSRLPNSSRSLFNM